MRQETLFTLDTPYRQSLAVTGFRFGQGSKSCAIVGALRGNEVQQMYVCSQLVRAMKKLEEQGAINSDREILVVPSVNHFSMKVGSRF
ncbi:MAG: succinylglutamate desuccinylase, partial [Clostridiales bacterium]|nr:succinylglutamate desuccinylase [Clostridiales bacterium]